MDDRTIVVVGAGLAGLRAVEQLRTAGWSDRIVVIGSEPHPPYNRPPLTKSALRDGVDLPALTFRQRPSISDVEWRLGTTVSSVALDEHTVTLGDGSQLEYAGLVIATGVSSRRLPLSSPLSWRHSIRTVEEAAALHDELVRGGRVVVVGGGFIGCEIACTAVELGCQVTVVESFAVPLEGPLGRLLGTEVQHRHEAHSVRFRTGRTVTAFEHDAVTGSTAVVLDDGTRLDADVVVESVGSTPNTAWLAGQGLDLTDGVLCGAGLNPLRAGQPVLDVVALGDVARFPVPLFGNAPFRTEHWTMPTEIAGHAARSLIAGLTGVAGEGPRFDPLPSFWSDQYGTRIQAFGIPAFGRDDVRLLEGDTSGEAAVGYHRDGVLVGVVLLGLGKQMFTYRQAVMDAKTSTAPGELHREGIR